MVSAKGISAGQIGYAATNHVRNKIEWIGRVVGAIEEDEVETFSVEIIKSIKVMLKRRSD